MFIEKSSELDLSPRPFEGAHADASSSTVKRLTLDGQQRITSGIALVHRLPGTLRYFLNLEALKKLADSIPLDYSNDDHVRKFVQELDDGDNYLIGNTSQTELTTLLMEKHWLSTTYLVKKVSAQRALEDYEERYPDTRSFLKYVVVPYFTLDNEFKCPVITLTKEEPVSAVTRIFATINTTGKRLTPIEIVTATLYSHEINLKEQVEIYRDSSDYLKNMDPNGEILLQTIALLAGQTPKKSLLPKTISHERFKLYFEEAQDLLDRVGGFLTTGLGVGYQDTDKLIPYDSILAPMAAVYKEIKTLEVSWKRKAEQKLEKWFIGAALSQRYQEGVHNKQENDVRDITRWIKEDSDEYEPLWLQNTQIPKLVKTASPGGAIGRLIKCLINRAKPVDPLDDYNVGYYADAEYPQEHHIWPKKFCTQYIPDWDSSLVSTDYALNLMPVSPQTNKRWDKIDPKNQIDDVKSRLTNEVKRKEVLDKLFLSDECVQILEKPDKTRAVYKEFIDARFSVFVDLLSIWGFSVGDDQLEDDVPSE